MNSCWLKLHLRCFSLHLPAEEGVGRNIQECYLLTSRTFELAFADPDVGGKGAASRANSIDRPLDGLSWAPLPRWHSSTAGTRSRRSLAWHSGDERQAPYSADSIFASKIVIGRGPKAPRSRSIGTPPVRTHRICTSCLSNALANPRAMAISKHMLDEHK